MRNQERMKRISQVRWNLDLAVIVSRLPRRLRWHPPQRQSESLDVRVHCEVRATEAEGLNARGYFWAYAAERDERFGHFVVAAVVEMLEGKLAETFLSVAQKLQKEHEVEMTVSERDESVNKRGARSLALTPWIFLAFVFANPPHLSTSSNSLCGASMTAL